ncbi:MAG: UDP-GlcNAc:undecaprenyl-phosphate/decaprenyl-phosphate GlcNAc-phosphate transferase [Acidobacteriota bacterium]|jgi:UDP-GlcNAc:undecaprenyl-phosphate GlcNAc-1-phosphate transferase|nr:UDP-GlcNAc:undecaprenyl-phosphate/decaprenyl-phosphate GlcNAc-phosphate transferase [Acidobacteriota bacterium]
MNNILSYALGAAILAALVTNLVVPTITRLALTLRAVDLPGERRHQSSAVPRLGGVAITAGLAVAAGAATIARWGEWGGHIPKAELAALALGTIMVFLVGVVDDLVGVSPLKKLVFELIAAALLVRVGWSFEVLRLPGLGEIHLGVWGWLVSILWIAGVTNAINLIDGLDGLAGGVVAIISTSLLVYAGLQGNPGSVVLMAATAGACLGFLRHNWEPARIFMGDSGSLTLGFLLGAVSIHSSIKAPAAVAILVPILALGVPVIDTLLVMAVRFLGRQQDPVTSRFLRMFHADRNHLHHLLSHFGSRRSRIVGVIYVVVLGSCSMALLVATTGQSTLGIALILVEFGVILAMRQTGLAMEARRLSRKQRDDIKTEVLGPLEEPLPEPIVLQPVAAAGQRPARLRVVARR